VWRNPHAFFLDSKAYALSAHVRRWIPGREFLGLTHFTRTYWDDAEAFSAWPAAGRPRLELVVNKWGLVRMAQEPFGLGDMFYWLWTNMDLLSFGWEMELGWVALVDGLSTPAVDSPANTEQGRLEQP